MSSKRIPLGGERFVCFQRALDERNERIREERLHLMVGGPESVPLPGCPECGAPAEHVVWGVYGSAECPTRAYELLTDVDPCGHRFRTALPLPPKVTVSESGKIFMTDEEFW